VAIRGDFDEVVASLFKSFPGCGQYLPHDRPVLFVQALSEFLDARNLPAARHAAHVRPCRCFCRSPVINPMSSLESARSCLGV
jgi:hypothetical protein